VSDADRLPDASEVVERVYLVAAEQTRRDRLAAVVSVELLELFDRYVDERVAVAVAALPREDGPRWLTLKQAAERLDCSADAVRMRVKRGRLEARREGRRVYVSRQSVDGLA
jgi:excisionase family DNA binding protein